MTNKLKTEEEARNLVISIRHQLQVIDIEECLERKQARDRREGWRGQVGVGAMMDSRREKVWTEAIAALLLAAKEEDYRQGWQDRDDDDGTNYGNPYLTIE